MVIKINIFNKDIGKGQENKFKPQLFRCKIFFDVKYF